MHLHILGVTNKQFSNGDKFLVIWFMDALLLSHVIYVNKISRFIDTQAWLAQAAFGRSRPLRGLASRPLRGLASHPLRGLASLARYRGLASLARYRGLGGPRSSRRTVPYRPGYRPIPRH